MRGEPGIDPCGQDAVIRAVGAAMAQATFSLVFDQIHLVSRPTNTSAEQRALREAPLRHESRYTPVGATLAVARIPWLPPVGGLSRPIPREAVTERGHGIVKARPESCASTDNPLRPSLRTYYKFLATKEP